MGKMFAFNKGDKIMAQLCVYEELKECLIGWEELLVECWHEGLGTREPVVSMHVFVFSSSRTEPCSLDQLTYVDDAQH